MAISFSEMGSGFFTVCFIQKKGEMTREIGFPTAQKVKLRLT